VTAPSLLPTHNGKAVPREAVPRLSLEDFRRVVIGAPERGARVAALFGMGAPDGGARVAGGAGAAEGIELFLVLASDREGRLELCSARLDGDSYPAMTPECPEVHLFEREVAEQWGIHPEGHPWLKPVRFAPPRRAGADPFGWSKAPPVAGVMDFYRVEGEEIHEVAVGPVHAGVIEPGHFRFQCFGEQVLNLEISLGYQHRGVERALVGGPTPRSIHYAETLAGDTTIGHATAYCHLVEALGSCAVPARAHAIRGIALELERLANHAGDLGAMAGDVGYLPTSSFCGRLRGDFLNLSAELCGSRFGRSLVRPGGVAFDVDAERSKRMRQRLDLAVRDVADAAALLWNAASVQARFEDAGQVRAEVAEHLGMVGPAARASGISRDARRDQPAGIFRFAQIPVPVLWSGDVYARAQIRALEIERSAVFIRELLGSLPSGETRCPAPSLAPMRVCASLVEGWRGELCHVALTDEKGRFEAYTVVDPSFHNWIGLAMALRDQQISDFPLCNKSFNLSYCGHDL
jgi:Ni,Fe-hydrogenase III large subunit